MPARAALTSRARQPVSQLAELPQARNLVPPELLAGSAGAPLEWARRFHRFFFDVADLAIEGQGLLVLQDVVIGRPSPVLREIQLWGATIDADDLLRMSSSDIALQVGICSDVQALICTEALLFVGAVEAAPRIDDVDLRRSVAASLVVSTTDILARLAPYVRIGEGVVWAYRPLPTARP
jgi:hypothetical protein